MNGTKCNAVFIQYEIFLKFFSYAEHENAILDCYLNKDSVNTFRGQNKPFIRRYCKL